KPTVVGRYGNVDHVELESRQTGGFERGNPVQGGAGPALPHRVRPPSALGQNASPHAHRVSTESMPAAGLNLATDIGIRDASGSQFPPMSDAVEFRGDRLGELGSHQAGEPSDGSRHTGEAGGEA